MKNKTVREEFEECDGAMRCNHERLDTHYIIGEDELTEALAQAKQEVLEEVLNRLNGTFTALNIVEFDNGDLYWEAGKIDELIFDLKQLKNKS